MSNMNFQQQPSPSQPSQPLAACVFCGSGPGARPEYVAAARTMGALLAQNGLDLVYGGGNVGLMGEIARATLRAGGHVTGIIPTFLVHRERMLDEAQETIVVPDMHTRKRLMYERSDAFIALPGGVGTLEELVEQMTWAQLGTHDRPILLVNTLGFWNPLLNLLDHMRKEAFIRPGLGVSCIVVPTPEAAIPAMLAAIRREAATPDAPLAERPAAPGPF